MGYALTLAAAALFGINGTVSTLALQAGIPATRLTALRCTGAAVCLLVVLAVVAPGRLRVTWREVPFLAVFGVVGVALTQFLYYVAIGRMPVGIALVFEMTAPVFIALYVWLVRREKVRSRLWLALLLSLSGLILVAEVWQDGGSLDPIGVGAALIAALCLAAYYLLGERGTVTRDPVALTCWSFSKTNRRQAVPATTVRIASKSSENASTSCRAMATSFWLERSAPSSRARTSELDGLSSLASTTSPT